MKYRAWVLSLLSTAVLAAVPSSAVTLEELNGIWYGVMEIPNGPSLRMAVEIYTRPSGQPGAALFSIDEGGQALIVDDISLEDDSIRLIVSKLGFMYVGTVALEAGGIEGEFRVSGAAFSLDLERVDQVPGLPRPQTPRPPYPYSEEEVSYENPDANLTLAGTLTLPSEGGPFPAVLLITGSGSQDRDETVFFHRPFRVLADYLTRRGIAVLRADDRGWGFSTGNAENSTSEDFVDDALAGVQYLESRSDIDPARIGLVGHSEGGLIAPMAAVRDPGVAHIVLLAGPGIPGAELIRRQRRDIVRSEGIDVSQEQLDAIVAWADELQTVLVEAEDLKTAEAEIRSRFSGMDAERRDLIGLTQQDFELAVLQMVTPWYRYFIAYDPAPTLRQVRVPVLALNGDKDVQVAADDNLAGIEAALSEGGNPDFTIVELPDINHFFQTATTGAVSEYMEIAETFSPEAMRIVADWIAARTGLPPADTAIARTDALPSALALEQNFPNPFNSATLIRFSLARDADVELSLYSALGQKIATLVQGSLPAGVHAAAWNGRDERGNVLSSGVYLYELRTAGHAQTRRLLLLR